MNEQEPQFHSLHGRADHAPFREKTSPAQAAIAASRTNAFAKAGETSCLGEIEFGT
jgi:hypothetical protein